MKKRVILLAVAALVLLAASLALAESSTVRCKLPDLGMTIDIPSDWLTFTRYIEKDDPNFEQVNTTYEMLMKQYETANIYLDAASMYDGVEIVVSMTPNNEFTSLNGLSDDELMSFGSMIMKSAAYTAPYESFAIYRSGNANFLVFEALNRYSGAQIYTRQFYTVMDSMSINIIMNSYRGSISQEMSDIMLSVVNSASFAHEGALILALRLAIGVFTLCGAAAIGFASWRHMQKLIREEKEEKACELAAAEQNEVSVEEADEVQSGASAEEACDVQDEAPAEEAGEVQSEAPVEEAGE